MNTEVFRDGFTANLTEERAQEMLSLLDNPELAADEFLRYGVVSALHDAYPDLEGWQIEPARGCLLELSAEPFIGGIPETSEGNTYYAARFSVSGLLADLRELVRRAKHRDGSTAAIQTSSAALSVLCEAADGRPDIAARLAAVGLDLSAIQFGDFPAGAPVVEFEPNQRSRSGSGIGSRPALAFPPAPAAVAPAPSAGGAAVGPGPLAAFPNLAAGTVEVGGRTLSVTAALALLDDLTRATRRLLLPAEGTAWVNDRMDPLKSSALVVLDPYLAGGLPVFPDGGAFLAEVSQSPEDGIYRAKLYNRSGESSQFGEWQDMNDAKTSIAKRVRPALQQLLWGA